MRNVGIGIDPGKTNGICVKNLDDATFVAWNSGRARDVFLFVRDLVRVDSVVRFVAVERSFTRPSPRGASANMATWNSGFFEAALWNSGIFTGPLTMVGDADWKIGLGIDIYFKDSSKPLTKKGEPRLTRKKAAALNKEARDLARSITGSAKVKAHEAEAICIVEHEARKWQR